MVNKRSTRHERQTEIALMNDFLISENQYLKKKNEELAKALSDSKMGYQKLQQDNSLLHEKVYTAEFERLKCQELIKSMGDSIENYVKQLINLADHMTKTILRKAKIYSNPEALKQIMNGSVSMENLSVSSNKTMAVMPMVDGHTILSPKINLPRVTVKQLTHMMSNNSNENLNTDNIEDGIEGDEIEFANNISMNAENNFENTSDDTDEEPQRRLETMQEEDEENISASQPLLSGVFKDVKVYISPLRAQHVIQFKSKHSPRKSNKSLNRHMNVSSVDSSINNSVEDVNIMQKSARMQSNASSSRNDSTEVQMEDTRSDFRVSKKDMKSGEYDPLEGPSNLLNLLYAEGSSFTIPNQTSTPTPMNNEPTKSELDIDESGSPVTPTCNVTQRKRGTKTLSSRFSTCSVKIQKLSLKNLSSYGSSNSSSPSRPSEVTVSDRPDSPTVLERSRRSSTSLSHTKEKAHSSVVSTVSPKKRLRRKGKNITYKEPSLAKKLRRS